MHALHMPQRLHGIQASMHNVNHARVCVRSSPAGTICPMFPMHLACRLDKHAVHDRSVSPTGLPCRCMILRIWPRLASTTEHAHTLPHGTLQVCMLWHCQPVHLLSFYRMTEAACSAGLVVDMSSCATDERDHLQLRRT